MTYKSQEFINLKNADVAIANNLQKGTEFTIGDLTKKSGLNCSRAVSYTHLTLPTILLV